MNSELQARLDDWCNYSFKSNRLITSHFLNEGELMECQTYLGKWVDYQISGGHPNAARKIIGFNGDPNQIIVCLVAKYNSKFKKLAHKDVYGALMNLKISKDKLGDILIFDDMIVIYVMKDIAMDIEMNLNRINTMSITFKESDIHYTKEIAFKSFTKTVSSLRLDSIVGSMTNLTRSKAQSLIKGKMVRINHLTVEENDAMCHNGDTISITGFGRFKFKEIIKETKKDKLLIEYIKYI